MHGTAAQGVEVVLGERMVPHEGIHGGCHTEGPIWIPCTHDTREQVIAETVGHFGQGIGRKRCNEQQIRPATQNNVKDVITLALPFPILIGIVPDLNVLWNLVLVEEMKSRLRGNNLDIDGHVAAPQTCTRVTWTSAKSER